MDYQEITLTEQTQEIMFDVRNRAHLTAEAQLAAEPDADEKASLTQPSDNPSEVYLLNRTLATRFSSVKNTAGHYLCEEGTTADNLLPEVIENGGALTLTLHLPLNFNTSATETLARSLHEYLVCAVLSEWYATRNATEATTVTALGASAIESFQHALYQRRPPRRPTYNEG